MPKAEVRLYELSSTRSSTVTLRLSVLVWVFCSPSPSVNVQLANSTTSIVPVSSHWLMSSVPVLPAVTSRRVVVCSVVAPRTTLMVRSPFTPSLSNSAPLPLP